MNSNLSHEFEFKLRPKPKITIDTVEELRELKKPVHIKLITRETFRHLEGGGVAVVHRQLLRFSQDQLITALGQLNSILTDPNCDGSKASLSSDLDLGSGNTLTVSATAEGDESLCAFQASQWNTL